MVESRQVDGHRYLVTLIFAEEKLIMDQLKV